jgi:tRNA 5-methylaminomethyl-2-thiouridine biosynthesis bifunctional protein
LVIGAGLAGSHIARKLAEAGCTVTVLERNSLASGGSSQPQGVIYTRPSHKHGKLADFSLAAYCLSTDHHQQLFSHQQLYEGVDGEMSGYIQLRDADKLTLLTSAFADEDSPVKFVTPEEASRIAGIPLDRGGMYFPDSGWLNPAGVCRSLINHPKITLLEGVGAVKPRQLDSGLWAAENQKGQTIAIGDTVILTTAWQATDSTELDFLPLQPIRGQTTQLSSNGVLARMRCTVCHDGYTPPARRGEHCIGATYGLNETTLEERTDDHRLNLSQLASNVPSLTGALSEQRLKGIAAVRCATSDYLPIAGPVPDKIAFNRIFEGLRHDRKRHIDAQQPNIEGLWVFTGLGSRGLTSAPLLSEMLVSMMFQRPPPLPRYLMQALSPARFLRRHLIKGE